MIRLHLKKNQPENDGDGNPLRTGSPWTLANYAFIGVLILLVSFFVLLVRSRQEFGFEVCSPSVCGEFPDDPKSTRIEICEDGRFVIEGEFYDLDGVVHRVNALAHESPRENILTVWVFPSESSKIDSMAAVVDALNSRLGEKVIVGLSTGRGSD